MDSACLHNIKYFVPTVVPVSTCSVDTHNTNMLYSSVTLTNHCSTLMDIQSMATMYVSCEHFTSIIVNS